jgi:hypothetical protein
MAVFSQSSVAVSSEVRCDCGGNHLPQDHWEFLESMSQRPTDMVDDLIKMGIYKSDVLDLASTLAQVEMREALLLRELGGGNPAREAFCRELLQEAGGLDQAMAAAFGVHATEFFSNTIRSGDYSRREFMKRVVVAASLIAIGSCAQDATKPADETPGKLEKPQINIGFIPITCATPIVMSEPLGFYEKQGLKVRLRLRKCQTGQQSGILRSQANWTPTICSRPCPFPLPWALGQPRSPLNWPALRTLTVKPLPLPGNLREQRGKNRPYSTSIKGRFCSF